MKNKKQEPKSRFHHLIKLINKLDKYVQEVQNEQDNADNDEVKLSEDISKLREKWYKYIQENE